MAVEPQGQEGNMAATGLTLVADVGGTNTRCALALGPSVRADSVRRYANAEHPGLAQVLQRYIADEAAAAPAAVCVAVAGPVKGDRASLTNLDWDIDGAELAAAVGAARVAILNDLQAQGHALGHIDPALIRTVLPFPPAEPGAARLVIGVGTGFNAAPVFEAPGGRVVPASESGHVTLPVRGPEEQRLADFVAREHGFPAVEDVLSGRGLAHVYDWLAAEAGQPGGLKGAEIMARLSAGSDPLAERAVRQMVRTLGAVAGNLALIQLPFGGVFLIGGMSRALTPWFDRFGFAESFADKGRFGPFMSQFGVGVVEDDYAALTGCAAFAVARLGR
jgi:glucokinase